MEELDAEDKRIAQIVGLEEDGDLPEVSEETMKAYHKFLSNNLVFPFEATYDKETGPLEDTPYSVKITRLLDFNECNDIEFDGLLCEGKQGKRKTVLRLAEITVRNKRDTNYQLVSDYGTWFWNYR
ncbi:MAG: calcium-binding protein [Planctomycetota bacterium]|nr:calcium-binding protein [Planctomycetota bacterium]MDI6786887.1 calcium-binding protein [Planctomycetota bacterium]